MNQEDMALELIRTILYDLRVSRELNMDLFHEEYITNTDIDIDNMVPYGLWFSELSMYEYSDKMLAYWATLRYINHLADVILTKGQVLNGTNPTFQELLNSLEGEVGDPDAEYTGL